MSTHYLEKLFQPVSIAVIGASNRLNSIGFKIFKNLIDGGFSGQLYAINPKYRVIQGLRCFTSVHEIKETIDLAIITTDANTIPNIITECGKKGIHNAIIISSGFSETDKNGKALEQHILNVAKGYHIRLLGPNCLGIMRPHIKLNATFDNLFALEGHLAFVSQSGALSAGILDWAYDKKIGFSAMVSLGNSVDVDFADVLDYLGADAKTQSILLYIEGIQNSRRFMSALRAAARMKPVIALKVGRHQLTSRTALSHTGAVMGDDEVFDVALRRAGAVRVLTIEELFLAAEILSSNYRLEGNRLMIITNGGGVGVMAADRAADLNIALPLLDEKALAELNNALPIQWSHQNPIDILGDATPERYHATLEICAKLTNVDGILAMLVPVAMVQPIKVAEQIIQDAKQMAKPLLACWMGGKQVKSSWNLFATHKIPYFDTPGKAVQAFSYLADYQHNQQLLLQVPEPLSPQPKPDIHAARLIIEKAIIQNRQILTTLESNALLKTFAIPVIESWEAHTHCDYELMVSVFRDIVFGPVIRFGAGGSLIEIMNDQALTLPPLNQFIAKQLIEQTRIAKLLTKFHNAPGININTIINILLRVSEMICELPNIQELNINPLIIYKQAAMAGDVEIIINFDKPAVTSYDHMAIHPYPNHLISTYKLTDGSLITLRPIRPEDANITQELVRNLSPQAKYFRFLQHIRELTPSTLARLTQIDYAREMTFIATVEQNNKETAVGLAHYVTNPDRESCEFALVVADAWQKKTIGSRLMKALTIEAKAQNLTSMMGVVLATNITMLELTQHLGFVISDSDDSTIKIVTKYN